MKTHWFPLIRPAIRAGYFLRVNVGSLGGVPLDCHDCSGKATTLTLAWVVYGKFGDDEVGVTPSFRAKCVGNFPPQKKGVCHDSLEQFLLVGERFYQKFLLQF